MHKLLIVDDEDIEREGMAELIHWENYGIELIGTAWNGVEGFEKIQTEKPDIVLTDIKMPVMNGIELIKRTKKNYPDIEFIVLSGYGEYEFTSQAMEEGVRHYILKPCDEERIVEVLNKVKKEIEKRKEEREKTVKYNYTVRKLLPRAKEQLFRNMLQGRENLRKDYEMFLDEFGEAHQKVRVLALDFEQPIDYLEQFVLENIIGELVAEENVPLSGVVDNKLFFLFRNISIQEIEQAYIRTRMEFRRVTNKLVNAAISEEGELESITTLYDQVQELFRMGEKEQEGKLLHYGLFKEHQSTLTHLVDYRQIGACCDYGELLFEIYMVFAKMELEEYEFTKKVEICRWIIKVLYGETFPFETLSPAGEDEKVWQLYVKLIEIIADKQQISVGTGREGERIRSILLATYRYIKDPDMNIRFLAKEVLYMNEEHFGRVFLKNQKVKYSAYLLEVRISMAKELMEFKPDIKISELVQMIGYAPDGQYFSKAFKKIVEMTPTEYRDKIIEEHNKKTVMD